MRQALGRGLDALLPKGAAQPGAPSGAQTVKIPIDKIRPNHLQPRKSFDPERLSELSASIREHGLAQPIVVSYDEETKTYELIAGERRLRATELAGFKEIEAVVRDPGSDRERLAVALIENLQREDLNPIDEALGYLRLMREAKVTQTDLTRLMGKSKSAISNTLRLLDLPESIQKALQFEQITEGHARVLLSIENPIEKQRLFTVSLEQKLSVRALEDLARQSTGEEPPPARPRRGRPKGGRDKTAEIRDMESQLQQHVGTKVEIRAAKGERGRLVLHYYSLSDFDRILGLLLNK